MKPHVVEQHIFENGRAVRVLTTEHPTKKQAMAHGKALRATGAHAWVMAANSAFRHTQGAQ